MIRQSHYCSNTVRDDTVCAIRIPTYSSFALQRAYTYTYTHTYTYSYTSRIPIIQNPTTTTLIQLHQ